MSRLIEPHGCGGDIRELRHQPLFDGPGEAGTADAIADGSSIASSPKLEAAVALRLADIAVRANAVLDRYRAWISRRRNPQVASTAPGEIRQADRWRLSISSKAGMSIGNRIARPVMRWREND